jgi:hypothetical protein
MLEKNFSRFIFSNSSNNRRGVFFWGLFLIILREPLLFVHTRFWAEEGIIFYSFAYLKSAWENFTTLQVGYYTLFNVAISELAVCFPVEKGPLITTLAAGMVQLIPVAIIAFTQSVLWDNFFKKLILITMFITLSPPEAWLNTTNIHCHFGLIFFLMVFINLEKSSRLQIWIFRLITPIAILSGPEALFIAPVYLYKAYKERKKENIIQAGIVVFFSIIQACIILYSLLYANRYGRAHGFSLSQFFNTFFTDGFGLMLPIGINDRRIIGMIIILPLAYIFWKSRKDKNVQYLFIAFLFVSVFTVLGSLGMESAPRYSYLPSCILILFMISDLYQDTKTHSWIYKAKITALVIIAGFTIVYFRSKLLSTAESVTGEPVWKHEVATWRKDKTYMLQVRPVLETDLRMKLSE